MRKTRPLLNHMHCAAAQQGSAKRCDQYLTILHGCDISPCILRVWLKFWFFGTNIAKEGVAFLSFATEAFRQFNLENGTDAWSLSGDQAFLLGEIYEAGRINLSLRGGHSNVGSCGVSGIRI